MWHSYVNIVYKTNLIETPCPSASVGLKVGCMNVGNPAGELNPCCHDIDSIARFRGGALF